jgi:sarcosine oxidase, subunit alpha
MPQSAHFKEARACYPTRVLKRLTALPAPVQIELDGQPVSAREGEPVACALLAAGETVFSRSPKYHRPRGPFCMEGACAQCLMRVDGVPNIATCRVPVRPGMRLERQNAYPTAKFDIFAATDWFFPRGLNHHELFAGVPVAEKVMARVARQLAGLGKLPDAPAATPAAPVELRTGVAIVGAGPAGLAAAAELGGDFLLFEREEELGGRLRRAPPEADAPSLELPPPEQLHLRTTVIGCFADDQGLFLAASQAGRLLKVRARTLLFCNGGVPQLLPFEGNDLPGVYAGRAVSALVRVHGVVPGKVVACVGEPTSARALASLLESVGARPVAVGAEPLDAHGVNAVSAITVRQNGREEKVACDAVAVCAHASPSFELASQAGAQVSFRPEHGLFTVDADADGRTSVAEVRVAGELLGPMSAARAAESGRRAARAIRGAP